MSTSSKRYHHGDLRAALLAVTGDLIARDGVEALSLREVSRRAGVSHAAAYNHFRDKAELVRAFVKAAFVTFAADLRRAQAAGSDPVDALRRIGVAYVLFAYRNQAEFRVMFRPELCGAAPGDGPDDAMRDSYEVLVESIVAAVAAHAIAGNTEVLTLSAWSSVHGLAALLVDGPGPALARDAAAVERLANATLTVLLEGMVERGVLANG